MFSADLSWSEPNTETLGERKARLVRDRKASSAAVSVQSSESSRASLSSTGDDRELWWASSIKKAKNLKPNKKNHRPGSSLSGSTHKDSRQASVGSRLPTTFEIQHPDQLKDPSLQPAWTYSSKISSTLPSGVPLDLPHYEVPELEGDVTSSPPVTNRSLFQHEKFWNFRNTEKSGVIDTVHEIQQISPGSFISRKTSRTVEDAKPEQQIAVASPTEPKSRKVDHAFKVEKGLGDFDFESLRLHSKPKVIDIVPLSPQRSQILPVADERLAAWSPPPTWNSPRSSPTKEVKQPNSPPVLDGLALAHNNLLELTRFQRFIRRMESAGPKVILDRLKEEWHEPIDQEADQELVLEKQLWILTAFQLQNAGKIGVAPKPTCNTGKLLELYGTLAEVYQLSAMHSRHKVQYLTTETHRDMPLPGNVSYLTVPQAGQVPLPYSDTTFSHIRASTLPSIVPSSKLPQILRECYRLLAPGGMLEIRIMDAAPVRHTAGPMMRAWIEDRLSLNLERKFRCSKPCTLVPAWVTDAGFLLSDVGDDAQVMKLPCTFDERSSNVDTELKTLVGRALWKSIWGEFVDDVPGEPRWWWEDELVMQECLERRTVFECGALYAHKR